jgi:hypothetical protein
LLRLLTMIVALALNQGDCFGERTTVAGSQQRWIDIINHSDQVINKKGLREL